MSKHNKSTKGHFGFWVASLLLCSSVYAGIPVWTYSAPNPASVMIADGGTATVSYTVTNQSHKTKNLILQATPGLSATACHLAGKGSTCHVTLTINGSKMPKEGIHRGPVLCEQSNPSQCYQPAAANLLNVVKSTTPPVTNAVISGAPSSLILTTTTPGNTGIVTITNNPTSTVNATNITADLSGVGGALSVSYSNCGSVVPGGVCTITFTAHTILPATSISVQGDNTNVVSVAVAVDQATISAVPSSFGLTQGGATQIVTITNNGPVDAYGVGISSAPGLGINVSGACASPMAPNDTCQLTFTSSSNTGNTTASIAGSNSNSITENITVTTASATTLSISVSSTPPAVIAVNGTGITLSIQNTGSTPAYNVVYSLPSGWSGVSTTGSCGDIAPGAVNACTLTFTATQPNVTNTIGFSADNVTPAVQSPAIAFSYQGYLVYAVTPTSDTEGTAYVVNDFDSANARWDSTNCNTGDGTSTCAVTNATSLTDGQYANSLGNTYQIITSIGTQNPPYSTNAAGTCYNITTSSVPQGTWYLPSICEVSGNVIDNDCPSGTDNIYGNLFLHGLGGFTNNAYYWSSTEYSGATDPFLCPAAGACAREVFFRVSPVGPQGRSPKSDISRVRCVQALTY